MSSGRVTEDLPSSRARVVQKYAHMLIITRELVRAGATSPRERPREASAGLMSTWKGITGLQNRGSAAPLEICGSDRLRMYLGETSEPGGKPAVSGNYRDGRKARQRLPGGTHALRDPHLTPKTCARAPHAARCKEHRRLESASRAVLRPDRASTQQTLGAPLSLVSRPPGATDATAGPGL